MAKNDSSKTVLIIVAIILGILLVGGIIVGGSLYWLYKIGTKESTPAPTSQTEIVTDQWLSYPNARFGFSLKYPQTFIAQESQNGDGITLTSSSPAITIRAYASNNALSQTLDEYLNFSRDNLFKETEGAEEMAAEETTLGGVSAQERKWQYINSVDGSYAIMDQVTALKGDIFYTAQMIIGANAYSEYAPMFDEILNTYQF